MPAGVFVPDFVIGVHLDAHRSALRGVEPVRDELELRDRVAAVARIGAVELHVVGDLLPVDVQLKCAAAVAEHRRFTDGVGPRARRQHRQVQPVAAVDRQVLHLARIDVARERRADVVSRSGASAVTVTDSCTVEGAICRFMTACCPTSSSTERVTVANPPSSTVMR